MSGLRVRRGREGREKLKPISKGQTNMLTKPGNTLALETIEWIGIGVVLIIVAVVAYRFLGDSIVGWINQVAGAIGG
jgi:hypothetical protein